MATNYNSELSKEFTEGGKIQISRDRIPTEFAEKVVPVMEVNPKFFRRINILSTSNKPTTGANTAYTTPTDRDFFLTNVQFSLIKDSTCDQATGTVTLTSTQDGVSKTIVAIPVITLTAQSESIQVNFPYPIKLDRGVIVTTTATYTVGVMVRQTNLQGYTVDNINA